MTKPTPPLGLTVPGLVTRIVDGDTLEVELTRTVAIRLEDCWCPEIRGAQKPDGEKAKANLERLAGGKSVVVHVPWKQKTADLFTFGRAVARVYVDGKDLSAEQVKAGFATEEKR